MLSSALYSILAGLCLKYNLSQDSRATLQRMQAKCLTFGQLSRCLTAASSRGLSAPASPLLQDKLASMHPFHCACRGREMPRCRNATGAKTASPWRPWLLEAFQAAASGREQRLVSRRVLKARARLRGWSPPNPLAPAVLAACGRDPHIRAPRTLNADVRRGVPGWEAAIGCLLRHSLCAASTAVSGLFCQTCHLTPPTACHRRYRQTRDG